VNTPFISIKTRNGEAPDFKSAGPHFNPDGKKHGLENPMGAHAGDMLNFTADEKGKAKVTMSTKSVNLDTDAIRLYSEGGPHWSCTPKLTT